MYSLRIYYEDTDAGGVVYNANYLKFFERARTEFLRDKGIDLKKWMDRGLGFVVSEVRMKFHRAARYGDVLTIDTKIGNVRAARFEIEHVIYRDAEVIVTGTTEMACVSGMKVNKLPPDIKKILESL